MRWCECDVSPLLLSSSLLFCLLLSFVSRAPSFHSSTVAICLVITVHNSSGLSLKARWASCYSAPRWFSAVFICVICLLSLCVWRRDCSIRLLGRDSLSMHAVVKEQWELLHLLSIKYFDPFICLFLYLFIHSFIIFYPFINLCSIYCSTMTMQETNFRDIQNLKWRLQGFSCCQKYLRNKVNPQKSLEHLDSSGGKNVLTLKENF